MAFDLINENFASQALMPGIKESESSQEVLQGQSVPAASELTQRVWVDAVQRDNKRQKKASGALETEPAAYLDTDAVLDKEVRKDSFVIHTDSLSVFQMMTLEQRGALFTAVAAFHRGSNEELEEMLRDPVVGVAFLSMKERFIRDAKEYANRCEANRKNARAGGLKRAENMKSEKGGKKGGKPCRSYTLTPQRGFMPGSFPFSAVRTWNSFWRRKTMMNAYTAFTAWAGKLFQREEHPKS